MLKTINALPLFSKAELNRYSQTIEISAADQEIVQSWCNRIDNQELLGEMQNYLDFYDLILRNLLGYTISDRQFERKTRRGKRVEFCIVDENRNPILIFELKGQNTRLDERPSGKQFTPIEQAHQYAYELGGTWYVVCSYVDFWLFNYHKPQRCHKLHFPDLLTNGELNTQKLQEFKFLLSQQQVVGQKILHFLNNRTEVYERRFTNQFYKLFHETRLMLIEEFQTNHQISMHQSLHLAQLVLNRLLFCLFAEDDSRGLLEHHILENQILNPLLHAEVRQKENRIWQNLLNLFQDINEGNTFRSIPAYDGELFSEDLSHLIIRDLLPDPLIYQHMRTNHEQQLRLDSQSEFARIFGREVINALQRYQSQLNPIYVNILIMASYDFTSEVNVDILGHIFELSLIDLENFTDLETARNNAIRRHADGIFYTPEFVTEYIVRKTLIHYLRKDTQTLTFDQLITEYSENIDELEKRLRNLKILDPACGSGAFLVKSIDLLTDIYRKIFHFRVASGVFSTQSTKERATHVLRLDQFFDDIDVRRQILLDCIYGVDINPESVEITKLSLFLKIAKKEVQFPDLSTQIKCGNSIVLDPSVADNAFKWKEEFQDVFEEGGFDIIVGNPPWGAELSSIRYYLTAVYAPVAHGQFDSFAIFLYHNIQNLLKPRGILGYIIPNELCLEEVNTPLRRFLIQYDVVELLNLGLDIFEDVTKPSLILIVRLQKPSVISKILVGVTKDEKTLLKTREFGIDILKLKKGYSRNQSSFSTNVSYRFDIWATEQDREITQIIEQNDFKRFKHYVSNGRGIDTNREGRYLVCPDCSFLNPPFGVGRAGRIQDKPCVKEDCNFSFKRDQADRYQVEYIFSEVEFGSEEDSAFDTPGYIGADLHKFRFSRKPRSFKYFGDKIDDPKFARYSKIFWKEPTLYQGEKLLIRKVSSGNVPQVMIHDGYLVFNQQLYCFQKKNLGAPFSLLFYLAVIGSRLFHYYYTKQFGDPDKETLPHFTQTKILNVPVPDLNTPSYSNIIKIMGDILEKVSHFTALTKSNFTAFLQGYPRVSEETFRDFCERLDPLDRQFPTVELESLDSKYKFCENDEWLEIYGKSGEAQLLLLRIKVPSPFTRRFLLEYLQSIPIHSRGSVVDRFYRIPLPLFSLDEQDNGRIVSQLMETFLDWEKEKMEVLDSINAAFTQLDELIFDSYNITKADHKAHVIDVANQNGFRVF